MGVVGPAAELGLFRLFTDFVDQGIMHGPDAVLVLGQGGEVGEHYQPDDAARDSAFVVRSQPAKASLPRFLYLPL